MEKLLRVFYYKNQSIEFDVSQKNMMLNATKMASLFEKKTNDFLRLEQTKNFIEACVTGEDSRQFGEDSSITNLLSNINSREDLIIVKDRSATWMHPVLAVMFAAWLSPAFYLWVLGTITKLLDEKTKDSHSSYLQQRTDLSIKIEAREQELRRSDLYKDIAKFKIELRKLDKEHKKQDQQYIEQQLPFWFPDEAKKVYKKNTLRDSPVGWKKQMRQKLWDFPIS